MARARAQAAERNLRHRDARDHHLDRGRSLFARSLLADLLARPDAPRDAAALLMADKNESFEVKDFGWMVVMSLLFFVLVAIGFWREYSTDWGSYQREFPKLLGHYGKVEEAGKFSAGIR